MTNNFKRKINFQLRTRKWLIVSPSLSLEDTKTFPINMFLAWNALTHLKLWQLTKYLILIWITLAWHRKWECNIYVNKNCHIYLRSKVVGITSCNLLFMNQMWLGVTRNFHRNCDRKDSRIKMSMISIAQTRECHGY